MKKLQKPYLENQNLLIAQDSWHAHYRISSITSLKEFKKLNVNTDMIIKNTKHVELNAKIVSVALDTQMAI